MAFNLTQKNVTKAYNGKQGCQCGCLGTYVSSGRALAMRVKKVTSFVGPMRPNAANKGDRASYSTEAFGGERYVYVDSGDRTTCVYFTN